MIARSSCRPAIATARRLTAHDRSTNFDRAMIGSGLLLRSAALRRARPARLPAPPRSA
jgi:hypothetical protein